VVGCADFSAIGVATADVHEWLDELRAISAEPVLALFAGHVAGKIVRWSMTSSAR
jgi:hypothetical protein